MNTAQKLVIVFDPLEVKYYQIPESELAPGMQRTTFDDSIGPVWVDRALYFSVMGRNGLPVPKLHPVMEEDPCRSMFFEIKEAFGDTLPAHFFNDAFSEFEDASDVCGTLLVWSRMAESFLRFGTGESDLVRAEVVKVLFEYMQAQERFALIYEPETLTKSQVNAIVSDVKARFARED